MSSRLRSLPTEELKYQLCSIQHHIDAAIESGVNAKDFIAGLKADRAEAMKELETRAAQTVILASPRITPTEPDGERSQNRPEKATKRSTPTDEMFRAYVACKLLKGITQTEIGLELGICQGTVSKHARKVQKWLDAGNKLPDIWSQQTNARAKVLDVNPHKQARWTPAHGDDGEDFDEE
jgi:DNA-binding NarL/FixJ family response regulator